MEKSSEISVLEKLVLRVALTIQMIFNYSIV